MNSRVLILEDTPARVAAMRRVLGDLLPRCELFVFDNAPDFIKALPSHLADAALICLDHDLGPSRASVDGGRIDPGTGRDAADALAAYPAVCPVIINSTNAAAVPGMLRVLADAGWTCSAVTPFDDPQWIGTVWRSEIKVLLSARHAGLVGWALAHLEMTAYSPAESSELIPHSSFPVPAQRPSRSPWPNCTARVQVRGLHPIEGYPCSTRG